MEKKEIGIILSSNHVSQTMEQVFGKINTGLVPVKGKPAITYIIDKFIQDGIDDIYITVDFDKERLIRTLNTIYNNKIKIHFKETIYKNKVKRSALEQIIKDVEFDKCIINVSDCIAFYDRSIINNIEPTILISDNIQDLADNFSVIIDENNYIKNFEINDKNRNVILGVIIFNDVKKLKEYNGIFSIKELGKYLINNQKIKTLKIDKWFCTNRIFKYYEAKKELLASRFFNNFEYNDLKGTITKRSINNKKLRKEILWFLNLPNNLKAFIPKILDYSIDENTFVEMEYYGYPSLSEIFVYGDFSEKIWASILKRLILVLDEFKKTKVDISQESFEEIYYNKLIKRIDMLTSSNPFFLKLLSKEKININGKEYYNLNHFKNLILQESNKLYKKDDCTIIHGDYFFANILYDLNNGIVRLIDPRGEWGDSIIYGDCKYDIAKLSHSINGKYDFIVNDMFELDYGENYINFKILNLRELNENLNSMFDKLISERYNLKQIRFIESLLFISMVPLHADHFKRQLVQYATGIKMLNEVFCE